MTTRNAVCAGKREVGCSDRVRGRVTGIIRGLAVSRNMAKRDCPISLFILICQIRYVPATAAIARRAIGLQGDFD